MTEINKHTAERKAFDTPEEALQRIAAMREHLGSKDAVGEAQRIIKRIEENGEWEGENQWIRR